MNAPDGALKAIIAYEPGTCAFPVSDAPTDTLASQIPLCNDTQTPQIVSDDEFEKLTKFPIIIIFAIMWLRKKVIISTARCGAWQSIEPDSLLKQ